MDSLLLTSNFILTSMYLTKTKQNKKRLKDVYNLNIENVNNLPIVKNQMSVYS